MKPSRSRIAASAVLSLDPGIFTVSNCAELAFLMRVSMSAMGSVIVMAALLPARLRHAGDLTGVDHRPQTDAAEAELAIDGLGSPAPLAPGVGPHLELRRPLLLLDE